MNDSHPTCARCRFASADHASAYYQCRRYPPTLRDPLMPATAKFPLVSPVNWCGEYKDNPDAKKNQSKRIFENTKSTAQ